ncbi:hypothetical protein PEKONANI_02170 [Aeromonas jandaei]
MGAATYEEQIPSPINFVSDDLGQMPVLTDFFLDICHIFRKLTPLHMTDSNNKHKEIK